LAEAGKQPPVPRSRPILLFFTDARSGPARRMESLLAHLARKERSRLRVARIDAEAQPDWIDRLQITEIPTLVLIKDRRPVGRLEGRVSAPQIERMISPHLEPAEADAAVA
jgi:thioredoxin 1